MMMMTDRQTDKRQMEPETDNTQMIEREDKLVIRRD